MRKYDKNVDQIEVLDRTETERTLYLTTRMPAPLSARDVLSRGAACMLSDEEALRFGVASVEDLR